MKKKVFRELQRLNEEAYLNAQKAVVMKDNVETKVKKTTKRGKKSDKSSK